MTTLEIKNAKDVNALWQQAVSHPFGRELAQGTLPKEKFLNYLMQDKIFCGSLRGLVCQILADCPEAGSFEAVHKLVAGLKGYDHEDVMFASLFKDLGVESGQLSEALPVTEAFGQFIWKIGTMGKMVDKLIVLYVVEALYMEWADRAVSSKKVGTSASVVGVYGKWIEIHTSDNMGSFVNWIQKSLDQLVPNSASITDHNRSLFKRTIEFEIMFWDAAYGQTVVQFPYHEKNTTTSTVDVYRTSYNSYIYQLIEQNGDLWPSAVHHETMLAIANDTLSLDAFKEYVCQHCLVTRVGVRTLLGQTVPMMKPEDKCANDMLDHMRTLQSGGVHYETVRNILHALFVKDLSQIQTMPATEALCDYMFKIGTTGTLHEKLLALTTWIELMSQRNATVGKQLRKASHPMIAKWIAEHHPRVVDMQLEYLDKCLSDTTMGGQSFSTSPICTESDNDIFKTVIKWTLLMDTALMHRGMFEWPSSTGVRESTSGTRSRNA